MTLVIIGPVTNDLIIIGDEKSFKVGGATYFQSFVFEKFFSDYLAIVNCSSEDFVLGIFARSVDENVVIVYVLGFVITNLFAFKSLGKCCLAALTPAHKYHFFHTMFL